jgi:hypothetical protein
MNEILTSLGFTPTTHERSFYHATIDDHLVLLCCQVDDIAITCHNPAIRKKVITPIGAKVDIHSDDLVTKFNGVEIDQTSLYVKVSCTSYLRRLLASHGWDTPKMNELPSPNLAPLPDAIASQIDVSQGPPELSSEHAVVGEFMYAIVTAQQDIGYVVTRLAKFSTSPHDIHCTTLKAIGVYLCHTVDWGIIYWRPTLISGLPPGSIRPSTPLNTSLPPFPMVTDPLTLVGYVDAAHATDLSTCRSVTGLVYTLCGAAVYYKSKLQPTMSTSSTEVEFIAAVMAAKFARYLCSILYKISCLQPAPTVLYADNQATILMINANRPTTRSCHIDIQHFAIQEWRAIGDILMEHIAGIINMSDALTKALGWTLRIPHPSPFGLSPLHCRRSLPLKPRSGGLFRLECTLVCHDWLNRS